MSLMLCVLFCGFPWCRYGHLMGTSFKNAVATKQLDAHRGRVVELREKEAVLSNGKTLPCDLLVLGTGYAKVKACMDMAPALLPSPSPLLGLAVVRRV